ncbi:MAG: HAD family hydrolase [Homoserinimonas sp.]
MLEGLQLFRNRGLMLGMLTNSVLEREPHRAVLLAGTLTFDHYLRSHEVGIAKPDPAIYELADTLLGSTDSRRVLIDDLDVNCVAAEAHGWSAMRHRDAQTTLAQLEVRFA